METKLPELTVEQKLAAIAEAMKTKKAGNYKAAPKACPIDPAERAACEGCQ